MHKNGFRETAGILFSLALLLVLLPSNGVKAADGDVVINGTNFPGCGFQGIYYPKCGFR